MGIVHFQLIAVFGKPFRWFSIMMFIQLYGVTFTFGIESKDSEFFEHDVTMLGFVILARLWFERM